MSKEVVDAAGEISDAWKDSGEEVRKAFNSFSDSIKSVLYDAEATAEDIADNIYQYMRNALVDSMFTAQLQPQIQAWYDKYTEFMKDGAIDTAERKTLDEMIAEIQKAGVDIVDAANKLSPLLIREPSTVRKKPPRKRRTPVMKLSRNGSRSLMVF